MRVERVRAVPHPESDGRLAPAAAALAVVVVRVAPLSARSLLALVEECNPDAIWQMASGWHLGGVSNDASDYG